MNEAQVSSEMARRVLQAAAVQAYGRPGGAYVMRNLVMQRANITDVGKFGAIAKYLYEKGWIAEPAADYGIFVVTVSGIGEAALLAKMPSPNDRTAHSTPSSSQRPRSARAFGGGSSEARYPHFLA